MVQPRNTPLVFISVAGPDTAMVRPLVEALRVAGSEVFYYPDDIQPGDNWQQVLWKRLAEFSVFVPILTARFFENAIGPRWTLEELYLTACRLHVSTPPRIIPIVHTESEEEEKALQELVGRHCPWMVLYQQVRWSRDVEYMVGIIRRPGADEGCAVTAAHNLMPYSGCFIGREKDQRRVEHLLDEAHRVVVQGMSGIGKTVLAKRVAMHGLDRGAYPGGVFWFDARSPCISEIWGSAIADALGLPHDNFTIRRDRALGEVTAQRKPTLLVLDDVPAWDEVCRPHPLPPDGLDHIRILVTTRRQFHPENFEVHSLKPLSGIEAKALLRSVSRRALPTSDGLKELLTTIGGHPLALTHVAKALEDTWQSPEGYLEAISHNRRPDASPVTPAPRLPRHAPARVLEHLWYSLEDRRHRYAWAVAAFFEPSRASVQLLFHCRVDEDALRELAKRFIVTVHAANRTRPATWEMHPLIRQAGRRLGWIEFCEGPQRSVQDGCMNLTAVNGWFRHSKTDLPHVEAALHRAELEDRDPEGLVRRRLELTAALLSAGRTADAWRSYNAARQVATAQSPNGGAPAHGTLISPRTSFDRLPAGLETIQSMLEPYVLLELRTGFNEVTRSVLPIIPKPVNQVHVDFLANYLSRELEREVATGASNLQPPDIGPAKADQGTQYQVYTYHIPVIEDYFARVLGAENQLLYKLKTKSLTLKNTSDQPTSSHPRKPSPSNRKVRRSPHSPRPRVPGRKR